MELRVVVHNDEQWRFTPQHHDEEAHTLITPNLSRLPPMPGGAQLFDGKKLFGTVESTSPRGTAFLVVYEPAPKPKRRKPKPKPEKVAVEVTVEKEDAE